MNLWGFYAATYKKRDEYVIAFRGTSLTSINDWMNNLHVIPLPTQYIAAQEYALKVIKEHPKNKVTLTGHSLGGGLAAYVAKKLSIPAYTFNPAPLWGLTNPKLIADYKGINNFILINNETFEMDVVSTTLGFPPTLLGKVFIIPSSITGKENLHKIENIYNRLESISATARTEAEKHLDRCISMFQKMDLRGVMYNGKRKYDKDYAMGSKVGGVEAQQGGYFCQKTSLDQGVLGGLCFKAEKSSYWRGIYPPIGGIDWLDVQNIKLPSACYL
ncbi:Mbeg1-like protein [Thiothrix fructosivorans]|uniref:DUF2974 domain-containing protein n=1 Tax=Thiothrix fructosivorans TaxID=111770 RepID=A0A8B0SHA2_9GAMM|nr:YqiA/YcfP family alpha/beta fold hydrolase [Thiothrix fructosivorans]MBO0613829.1 DUF2974 domain-containing protein [Thiothrix fructosivorans]QTX10199.1 DUF2974 domain-containing protein [Thiothrix fructosivorans]